MHLFRICPEKYLDNYQGPGASYKDGARWNIAGIPVIYFALSPGTALLEMANYIPSPRFVPKDFRLGIYDLPDKASLFTLPQSSLPNDWAQFPYPSSAQGVGSKWLREGEEVGMLVPSAAVPEGLENILVFNPNNKDCGQIKLIKSTSNLYNQRMFTGI